MIDDPGLDTMRTAQAARVERDSGSVMAWIDGRPASLDEAAVEAARLLAQSNQPLIAGLGSDIEGARAAIALFE